MIVPMRVHWVGWVGLLIGLCLQTIEAAGREQKATDPQLVGFAQRDLVKVTRRPRWVDRHDLPEKVQPPKTARAFYVLTYDRQTRVGSASSTERYYRLATQVLTVAGIDSVAKVEMGFDPAYQRLAIHGVYRVRSGRRRSVLDLSQVKLIQQERELDLRIYNGRLTAILFVPDVRVGDIVECEYSLVGFNPVFAENFYGGAYLARSVPVGFLRERILMPSGRPLQLRTTGEKAVRSRSLPGYIEHSWQKKQVPAIVSDGQLPTDYELYPQLTYSEAQSWSDVVRWALPLYRPLQPVPANVLKQIAAIKGETDSKREQLSRAIRFVQDEVRYLGIEMGQNSHRPHPPSEVLERRFGDCKDKTLLLATLLHGLDIEADPALVHTGRAPPMDALPTPLAFNHVILRIRTDGETHWVDATSMQQGGAIPQPQDFGRALVLRVGSTELVDLPEPSVSFPDTELREGFKLRSGKDSRLTVHTVYRRGAADSMRARMARTNNAAIDKSYLNFYLREYENAERDGQVRLEDDRGENEFVVDEAYILDRFLEQSYPRVRGHLIQLPRPTTIRRRMPFDLGQPRSIRHVLHVELPYHPRVVADTRKVEDEAFAFEYSVTPGEKGFDLDYQLRVHGRQVAAKRLREYLDHVDEVEAVLSFRIPEKVRPAKRGSRGRDGVTALALAFGLIGVIALAWGAGKLRYRWRRSAIRRRHAYSPGEAAHTALACRVDEISKHSEGRLCQCRQTLTRVGQPAEVLLGGESLTVVQLSCRRCSRSETMYFRVQDDSEHAKNEKS